MASRMLLLPALFGPTSAQMAGISISSLWIERKFEMASRAILINYRSPRKARFWREAKSMSSLSDAAACAVFALLMLSARLVKLRCNSIGGTAIGVERTSETLIVFNPDVVLP